MSKEITGFYRKFYEFNEVHLEEGDFCDNCPKLTQDAGDRMEVELSETELVMTQYLGQM